MSEDTDTKKDLDDARGGQKPKYSPHGRTQTIVHDFLTHVREKADKAAIVSHHQASDTIETCTYRQLGRLVDRIAVALLDLGVQPGDIVSIQMPNQWQFSALHLAISRIGATTNPLIPILRDREARFILERTESPIFIVQDVIGSLHHAEMASNLHESIPTLQHVFAIGDRHPESVRNFDEFFLRTRWEDRCASAELDAFRPNGEAFGQLQFTSGTTGEPKGVLHTHNTMYAATLGIPVVLDLDENDVVLMASTMAHQTGFLYGLCMPMHYGMKAVYMDAWDPAVMLRLVQDEEVTWTMGATPFVLDACSAAQQTDTTHNLASLRYFTCGGAPIPPHAIDLARRHLGTKLIAVWGMTENGVCTISSPTDSDEKVASTDGKPLPWMSARIAGPQNEDLPAGTEGRLLVRGASQFVTYFKRPDLYDAAHGADGWFDTGDLAYLTEDGYLRITGRSKDIIIRGGENVPVAEVEAILYRHPKVAEAALVGIPDERLSERGCAVIVPAGEIPPTLEELTTHLDQAKMARQFWPEHLEIRDTLPKTVSGKIQKFKLRQEFAARAPQSPAQTP